MADQRRAARALVARMGELGLTQEELAAKAGVNVKTIGNFTSRGRWPIARTRAKLERTLGWPPGKLERIAAGDSAQELDYYDELYRAWEQVIRSADWGLSQGEVKAHLEALGKAVDKLRAEGAEGVMPRDGRELPGVRQEIP